MGRAPGRRVRNRPEGGDLSKPRQHEAPRWAARPTISILLVLQGGRMVHFETVARQLWPLPSFFALSLLHLA